MTLNDGRIGGIPDLHGPFGQSAGCRTGRGSHGSHE
jgi:hypothetical protein